MRTRFRRVLSFQTMNDSVSKLPDRLHTHLSELPFRLLLHLIRYESSGAIPAYGRHDRLREPNVHRGQTPFAPRAE